jgi:hypothetical protein
MSRSADIDFNFTHPVSVATVAHALATANWWPTEPLGVSFLVEDDGDFDWERGDPATVADIIAKLDEPENLDVHVGISVYHQGEQTGGTLLFFPGREQASFTPSINRRPLPGEPRMTDISWYINELVPPLLGAGLSGYEARDLQD